MKSMIYFILILCIKFISMQRNYSSVIRTSLLPRVTDKGFWGPVEYCSPGHFAVGFRSKLDIIQNYSDNTGMNGIELRCSDTKNIKSSVDRNGEWAKDFSICPQGHKLIGFRTRIQADQGRNKDDTATNTIQMKCSDGKELKSLEGNLGDWLKNTFFKDGWQSCGTGRYICGLSTQIHSPGFRETGDFTSLNNFEFYCC